MKLFTIGFTKKTAEQFFEKLKSAGVKRVVDIRLKNTSQLAGFAKSDDLVYFLKTLCGIKYVHMPDLAPDKALLEFVKKEKGAWETYEAGYLELIAKRKQGFEFILKILKEGDCLLCSEHTPEHCHRRIVAEQVKSKNDRVQIVHL